jgi:hypothetical protein
MYILFSTAHRKIILVSSGRQASILVPKPSEMDFFILHSLAHHHHL